MDNIIARTVDTLMLMKKDWLTMKVEDKRKVMENFHNNVNKLGEERGVYDTEACMVHHYGDNTYGREANIPKGILMVGSTYKEPQINILLKGKVFVMTENIIDIMKAPFVFTSDAGTNKVGMVIEDMQWITIVSRDNMVVEPDDIMKQHLIEGG